VLNLLLGRRGLQSFRLFPLRLHISCSRQFVEYPKFITSTT
jgi:hypothetical protein